jgi:hypothetical protein
MKTLADIAAAERLLSPARLAAATRRARTSGEPLVVVLVKSEKVAEERVAAALARHLGLRAEPLGDVDEEVVREVPNELARARRLVPLSAAAGVLRLAMADPTDREAIDDIEASSGARVEPVLGRLSEVEEAVRRAYRSIVTAVMSREERETPQPPPRRPFGGDLVAATDGGRAPALPTQPHSRPDEDAPLELRHRALLELLCARGVITYADYLRELRRLTSGS